MRSNKIEELNKYFVELKTKKIKRINKNSTFLKTEQYQIKLNNNEIINREKLRKGNSDGSASIIVPVTETNEFLVAIEPRVFTKRTVDIGFPAGYVDYQEDILASAKRELREETGYTVENITLLGQFYQDQGISAALNSYFLGTNAKKEYNQELDEDEIIRYMTFTSDEIEELISKGYMTGLNSAYAFEKSKQLIRKR